MRSICASMQEACGRYSLGQTATTALTGGYLILRFFNPALVSPKSPVEARLALRDVSITAACRRNLMLIAKVLQAAANGTTFGAENTLAPLNAHVTQMCGRMGAFLSSCAAPCRSTASSQARAVEGWRVPQSGGA